MTQLNEPSMLIWKDTAHLKSRVQFINAKGMETVFLLWWQESSRSQARPQQLFLEQTSSLAYF